MDQWLFTQFFAERLVDYGAAPVSRCPDCETVLADAQVETPPEVDEGETTAGTGHSHTHGGGVSWRCGTDVEQRDLDQWFFAITDYAEELYPGSTTWRMARRRPGRQRNWIGRQEGARVAFSVGHDDHGTVEAFTTRLDTVYGATYRRCRRATTSPGRWPRRTTMSPTTWSRWRARMTLGMSGVETDLIATHPYTGEELPVYVAAYVLDDVGTGAVMGVPAHNEQDHAFADEHDLPVEQAVEPVDGSGTDLPHAPYTGDGMLMDSGEYDGLASSAARERLREHEAAESAVTYRLRDWLISRQRYSGTPIPIVHCDDCGHVRSPRRTSRWNCPTTSRRRGIHSTAQTSETDDCPDCGADAVRRDGHDGHVCRRRWSFRRILAALRGRALSPRIPRTSGSRYDVYVGGEEHGVMHLLDRRFFTRALSDIGLLDREEPVERLINQGTVLHSGEKMSKSKGNDIAPHEYGAETTRLFVLSAAHPSQDFEWTVKDVSTAYDFQQTLYRLVTEYTDRTETRTESTDHDTYLEREIDRTIAAVPRSTTAFASIALSARYSASPAYWGATRATTVPTSRLQPRLACARWPSCPDRAVPRRGDVAAARRGRPRRREPVARTAP